MEKIPPSNCLSRPLIPTSKRFAESQVSTLFATKYGLTQIYYLIEIITPLMEIYIKDIINVNLRLLIEYSGQNIQRKK